jgi:hypothetical protein
MTIIQSTGIKHPKLPFQWGAGTLSVMGISFTTMPIAQAVVPQLKRVYATENSCGLKVRLLLAVRMLRGMTAHGALVLTLHLARSTTSLRSAPPRAARPETS